MAKTSSTALEGFSYRKAESCLRTAFETSWTLRAIDVRAEMLFFATRSSFSRMYSES
jgi:hypothetical protein